MNKGEWENERDKGGLQQVVKHHSLGAEQWQKKQADTRAMREATDEKTWNMKQVEELPRN